MYTHGTGPGMAGRCGKLETYLDFNPRKSGLTQVFPDTTAQFRLWCRRGARGFSLATWPGGGAPGLRDPGDTVCTGGRQHLCRAVLEMMDMPAPWWWRKQRGPRQDHDEAGLPGLRFVRADTAVSRQEWLKDKDALINGIQPVLPYPVLQEAGQLRPPAGVSRADSRGAEAALSWVFPRRPPLPGGAGADNPEEVNCGAGL